MLDYLTSQKDGLIIERLSSPSILELGNWKGARRVERQCPLWVKSGHPTTPCRTSASGGKADIERGLIRNHDLNVRYWG